MWTGYWRRSGSNLKLKKVIPRVTERKRRENLEERDRENKKCSGHDRISTTKFPRFTTNWELHSIYSVIFQSKIVAWTMMDTYKNVWKSNKCPDSVKLIIYTSCRMKRMGNIYPRNHLNNLRQRQIQPCIQCKETAITFIFFVPTGQLWNGRRILRCHNLYNSNNGV